LFLAEFNVICLHEFLVFLYDTHKSDGECHNLGPTWNFIVKAKTGKAHLEKKKKNLRPRSLATFKTRPPK